MCVFNFFFRKSWLAGEGDHLLRKKKLKAEFCGCSDTRRAFSRACIAKCAYHKPPLRGGWAALPLRPSGSATRRRPSRRTPQSRRAPAGKRGFAGAKAACGRPGPKAKKKGSPSPSESSVTPCAGSRMPLDLFEFEVRPPFQEKFEARMRLILSSKLAS